MLHKVFMVLSPIQHLLLFVADFKGLEVMDVHHTAPLCIVRFANYKTMFLFSAGDLTPLFPLFSMIIIAPLDHLSLLR